MMFNRIELKNRGKYAFRLNYWYCVVAGLIFSLITAGSSNNGRDSAESIRNGDFFFNRISGLIILAVLIIALATNFLVRNTLEVGVSGFFARNAISAEFNQGKTSLSTIIDPFKYNYINTVVVMFMYEIIIALWSLLLIIPGIYKSYEYRMVPYIIADDPNVSWQEALRISKNMMNGNKMDAFVMDLSFLGWHLLGLLTLGILDVFWTCPYQCATNAELYLLLKKVYFANANQYTAEV